MFLKYLYNEQICFGQLVEVTFIFNVDFIYNDFYDDLTMI